MIKAVMLMILRQGFMAAPWKRTLPENRTRIMDGISQLVAALKEAGA